MPVVGTAEWKGTTLEIVEDPPGKFKIQAVAQEINRQEIRDEIDRLRNDRNEVVDMINGEQLIKARLQDRLAQSNQNIDEHRAKRDTINTEIDRLRGILQTAGEDA